MSLPSPSPDSRALITGASQGIGMAIARDLAKQGHHVILVARRKDVLEQFAAELTSRYNVTAEVFPCDLSDEQQRHKLIAEVKDRDISIISILLALRVSAHSWTKNGSMRPISSSSMPQLFLNSPAPYCPEC